MYFDDLELGHRFETVERTVTNDDIVKFAKLSGDHNPLHVDEAWVRANTGFGSVIAHGLLMTAITSGLSAPGLDDLKILAYLAVSRDFVGPAYPGDTVHAVSTVMETRPSSSNPTRGIVAIETELINQDGVVLQRGLDTYLVARRTETGENA